MIAYMLLKIARGLIKTARWHMRKGNRKYAIDFITRAIDKLQEARDLLKKQLK